MPAYWWECESCGKSFDFSNACNRPGIAHYIRDVLAKSSWDQSDLLLRCSKCGNQALRITYEFPRADKETLRVVHIVGLGSAADDFIPMMWETYPLSNTNDRWFDFKYISGRNAFGLNRPVVLSLPELKQVFQAVLRQDGRETISLKSRSALYPDVAIDGAAARGLMTVESDLGACPTNVFRINI